MTREVSVDAVISSRERGWSTQRIRDVWEFATAVLKWGALVIGGLCLLVNSATIGHFPEDITLGEGLAVYFLSVGFIFAYALYWIGITSVGLCLFRWVAEGLRYFRAKIPKHAPAYLPADFSVLWKFPVWLIALFTVLIGLLLFRPRLLDLLPIAGVVLLQGSIGLVLFFIRRKLRFEETGLSIEKEDSTEAERRVARLRHAGYGFVALWVAMPFLIGQSQGTFFDAAFRLAQLRKDHATVHVAQPWDRRLASAGYKQAESFLGDKYARFDDVTVRLRSIGSTVVIEAGSGRAKSRFISIPREAIEVE